MAAIIQKHTNYLNFDKSRMVNLEYSLNREILRTNRRGAYHCTSLAECNTRKQHGLLVVPVPKLGNTNHVLLSSFSESIIQHGAEFNLGINKYDGDYFSPMGHKYIREFSCDSVPKIVYRVGGVVFSKEKMFSLLSNTIFIRYTLIDTHTPTTIRFNPFLAFRGVNGLTYENAVANLGYKEIENGISMCMYSGYPDLYMQFSKLDVKFEFDPKWYKGIEYPKDQEEGLAYKEDLYVPGYFEMPIEKGETIIFAASDTAAQVNDLSDLFARGIKRRTPRSSFFNCLKNSAQQFYYRPTENETYLLNGYPWGKVVARDQFMALEGVTVSIDRVDVCEEILDTAKPALIAFMKGRENPTMLEGLDEPDVFFWILRSMRRFYLVAPDKFKEKYSEVVKSMVLFILENKHPRLRVTDNMLLYTDGRERAASWMNGSIDGKLTVPRTGYLVEVNTFWYNSLMFSEQLASDYELRKDLKLLRETAAKVKESFNEVFVNEAGYLFDYVDGYKQDWSVRPNMLYAVSSHYAILDKNMAKSVLDIATKELLMSKGLRTLSPKSPSFRARYEGTREEKAFAEYNGVARAWLIAPYLEAYVKVFQRSGLAFLERMLAGIEEEMANDGIGSLSSMYDGNMPSRGHGAISSTIDVAGVLRAIQVRNTFADKY